MPYNEDVDRSEYARLEHKEARLRLRVLDAHLKVAETGAYEHIVYELAMLGLGKLRNAETGDFEDADIKPTTRVAALRAALRGAEKAAGLGTPQIHIEGGTKIENMQALILQAEQEELAEGRGVERLGTGDE